MKKLSKPKVLTSSPVLPLRYAKQWNKNVDHYKELATRKRTEEDAQRIADAEAKRDRRAAKRAQHA